MMRRLYLVRHGQTHANLDGIVQGRRFNPSLNETGLKQADLLGQALSEVHFQHIYFSPLLRARETAKIIFEHGSRPSLGASRMKDLEEIDQGDMEGMRTEEIKKRMAEFYSGYKAMPSKIKFPNGESMIAARMRVGNAFNKILLNHDSGNILVVSHGGTISLAFIHLFAWDFDTMFHAVRHHNCGLSIIEWPEPESRPRIICVNDICHLNINHSDGREVRGFQASN